MSTKSATVSPATKVQTPAQYLAQAAVRSAGINFILNLLAGWLIYRKLEFMPLEGEQSLRVDSTVMVFIIVFFSLLLAVPGLKKQLRSGLLLPYESAPRLPGVLRWLLGSGLPLAVLLAFAGVFVYVPLLVWALAALGVSGLALWPFLAFKALLAALTAATLVPMGDGLVILNESGKK